MTGSSENSSDCNGAMLIGGLRVTSYNVELRDGDDFIGDKASVSALLKLVEERRYELAAAGPMPVNDKEELSPEHFDAILESGTTRQKTIAEEILGSYVERLAFAIKSHLGLNAWQNVRKILVGGGFERTRAGKAAITRAADVLASMGHRTELQLIRHHGDDAGLVGCIHLAPDEIMNDAHAILACDIGGTNFRCGIVSRGAKVDGLAGAKVWAADKWRHGGREQSREQAVDHLASMLLRLVEKAERSSVRLAPFVGIACPGVIRPDGRIERGAQNLPGDWEDSKFSLAELLRKKLPAFGQGTSVEICTHNDAVVQGLSEAPFMRDMPSWAIVTIGTGFGNASFQRSS